jgi:hypothetical protein
VVLRVEKAERALTDKDDGFAKDWVEKRQAWDWRRLGAGIRSYAAGVGDRVAGNANKARGKLQGAKEDVEEMGYSVKEEVKETVKGAST